MWMAGTNKKYVSSYTVKYCVLQEYVSISIKYRKSGSYSNHHFTNCLRRKENLPEAFIINYLSSLPIALSNYHVMLPVMKMDEEIEQFPGERMCIDGTHLMKVCQVFLLWLKLLLGPDLPVWDSKRSSQKPCIRVCQPTPMCFQVSLRIHSDDFRTILSNYIHRRTLVLVKYNTRMSMVMQKVSNPKSTFPLKYRSFCFTFEYGLEISHYMTLKVDASHRPPHKRTRMLM